MRPLHVLKEKDAGIKTELEKKDEDDKFPNKNLIVPLVLATVAAGVFATGHLIDLDKFLDESVERVAELGPWGYLYFSLIYIFAEIVAIPAVPLTASSGYLFGLLPGTLVVLTSATIAASISFYLGRTFLREWAMQYISGDKRWVAIDKAIAREGFKVVLLLRLSPLLPFALSNYLYALTSVDFASFISATFLGFAPGSFGFVYFGTAGKALFETDGPPPIPWYAYVGVGLIIALGAQTIGKIASDALKLDEEENS
ncbi:snare associated Golgi protein-domain-containing protein [Ochromonadaceae sp. CCMP2298]|nr:snare associated Golgi protein-domain-containing protein [Ochromonadaceae sp. CCMP2298]